MSFHNKYRYNIQILKSDLSIWEILWKIKTNFFAWFDLIKWSKDKKNEEIKIGRALSPIYEIVEGTIW